MLFKYDGRPLRDGSEKASPAGEIMQFGDQDREATDLLRMGPINLNG
jgi:hypothetical protein